MKHPNYECGPPHAIIDLATLLKTRTQYNNINKIHCTKLVKNSGYYYCTVLLLPGSGTCSVILLSSIFLQVQ